MTSHCRLGSGVLLRALACPADCDRNRRSKRNRGKASPRPNRPCLGRVLTPDSSLPVGDCRRGEALQGMLVLAAATQHAEGHPEHGGGAVAAVAGAQQQQQQQQQPRRHESASSDNEYSEGQYAPPPAQQQQQRTGQRGHVESEEEKKEKRSVESCSTLVVCMSHGVMLRSSAR